MSDRPTCIQDNYPIAELTTFEIGGKARYFAEPASLQQMTEVISWARQSGLPIYPIGGGSNILASEKGYSGILLRPNNQQIEYQLLGKEDSVLVRADAGIVWDDFVAYTVKRGWQGIECLSAIPGRVGASPIQNIGAYGQEVAHTIQAVEVLSLNNGTPATISASDCHFAYRSSIFKTTYRQRYLITAVHFLLSTDKLPELRYRDLKNYFADKPQPSLSELRQAVIAIRKSKSMIYDENDPNHRSAGSFFLNPIIPQEKAKQLAQRYPQMPIYSAPEGFAKLSAAWLMDQSGFHKGFTLGKAKLSDNHNLCLVNTGGAQAEDMLNLARLIQRRVNDDFQIELFAEPNMLGF